MLGYQKNTKGYRLWSIERKTMVINRVVLFMEDVMPYLKERLAKDKDFNTFIDENSNESDGTEGIQVEVPH